MFYINVLRDYDKRTIVDTSNNLENNVSPADQNPRSDTQQDFEYAESFEQEAQLTDDAEFHATGAPAPASQNSGAYQRLYDAGRETRDSGEPSCWL